MTHMQTHDLPSPEPKLRSPRLVHLIHEIDHALPHRGISAEETLEDGRWVIRAQLPGLDRHSAIELTLSETVLTVDVALHAKPAALRSQLHQLHQVFSVPTGTRLEDITTAFADGVLTLTMPAYPAPRAQRTRPSAPQRCERRSRISVTSPATQPEHETDGRVVVGVDGTRASVAALRWALPLIRQEHCPVEIVSAWTNNTATASHQIPGHVNEQRERAAKVAAAAAALAERELPDDVRVTTSVVMGRPADVLAERSEGARFLILGSSRSLGDGVPRECQQRVHCPVFIVLPPQPAAEQSLGETQR